MIKSGDYQYILLTDGTAELTNYTAYAEFLTVPAQIDGHAVASIGSEAFINSEFLSSIILPDCLTTIGIDAFCGCSFLTSITLPNSLTTIGNWAFKSCPVSLNFTAVRGSWAESWCKENGKNYTYSNSID
ncbi:MAG: leucine-rich repeat domain-containing protein [Clostridiales bacterium]|nr:leucine-rich repeat domain-containing protein [Clostridiales bacterium]MDY5468742.1 leucine-rich repeat domain-containing protein [Eubacteriales bacterium]